MEATAKKSRLSLIISMLIFGTIGIFRRYIPLPSGFIAMTRGLVGMLFLLVVMTLSRKKMNFKLIKKNLPVLVASSVAMGFNWILLFEAYRYTSVSTATLCYYMAPVIVIILSPLLFKEKLTAKKIICCVVALVGMVFVSGIFEAGFSGVGELRGVFFGLSAAVLYASVVILNKKLTEMPSYDKTVVQLGTSAVVLLIYVLLTENLAELSFEPVSLLMLLVVGVVHTGVAYVLYFGSIGKLKAQTVALLSYIDPVSAIILSAVILNENMGITAIVGAVLVLGSTLVSEFE